MMESHDECRKVVHRPWSSCISSIQNLIGTPLSSFCQLRLKVDLSHHGLDLIVPHSLLKPNLCDFLQW